MNKPIAPKYVIQYGIDDDGEMEWHDLARCDSEKHAKNSLERYYREQGDTQRIILRTEVVVSY